MPTFMSCRLVVTGEPCANDACQTTLNCSNGLRHCAITLMPQLPRPMRSVQHVGKKRVSAVVREWKLLLHRLCRLWTPRRMYRMLYDCYHVLRSSQVGVL